ncbi:MAG TPA: hypothetical protein VGB55_02575 [Tepidisphaeraceae bacterium]
MADDLDRQKALFDYAKEVVKDESDRFKRVDEKAVRYITALTFVLVAATFLGKWIIDRLPQTLTCLDWAVVGVGLIYFIATLLSWALVFRVLAVAQLTKPPLREDVLDWVETLDAVQTYRGLTQLMTESVTHNRSVTNNKSERLYLAYCFIVATTIVFSVLCGLFFSKLAVDRYNSLRQGQILMEHDKQNTQSPPAVQPVTKPSGSPAPTPSASVPTTTRPQPLPALDLVTEGYKPPVNTTLPVKRGDGGSPSKTGGN